jgi:hypothetical protein
MGKNRKYDSGAGKALRNTQQSDLSAPSPRSSMSASEAVFDTTQNDHNSLIFNGLSQATAENSRYRPTVPAC